MNDLLTILQGDAIEQLRTLQDESVHCCVTSPPYWGLRDYSTNGQIGLEKTPEEYVAKMVEVFREVRRVLRKDGTLWLNLGDSYASDFKGSGGPSEKQLSNTGSLFNGSRLEHGLKPKDLCGIPWRVAFALQADGWWLRSDIIWAKPNPMPESVTDRPTKSHEYIFLLTKSSSYFYDAEAIKEKAETATLERAKYNWCSPDTKASNYQELNGLNRDGEYPCSGNRNKRSVWTVATAPYPEAHFATYPPDLIKPCIMAGTSAKGCCAKCGSPWRRVVESKRLRRDELDPNDERYRPNRYKGAYEDINGKGDAGYTETKTIGWQRTCKCEKTTCETCSIVLESVSNKTEIFEHGERLAEKSRRYKELQKLFSKIHREGMGCEIQSVLQEDLRGEMDDESQEQETSVRRADNKLSGLSDAVDAGDPVLRHGTSGFDGEETRTVVAENRGGSSLRRRQGKQQDRELSFDDPTGAQPFTEEPETENDHLSSLQQESDCSVECPICRTELQIEPFETEPCVTLDCFAGSGTTGAVALELGRKAILIELNPKYVELIRQRCDVTPGLALA